MFFAVLAKLAFSTTELVLPGMTDDTIALLVWGSTVVSFGVAIMIEACIKKVRARRVGPVGQPLSDAIGANL
jgi:hypothetical protein